MKYLKLIFLSIICNSTLWSQDCSIIDDWNKFSGIAYVSINPQINNEFFNKQYSKFLQCADEMSNKTNLAKCYNMIGYYSHYTNQPRENTISYILKSFVADSVWFRKIYCEETRPAEKDLYFEKYYVENYNQDLNLIITCDSLSQDNSEANSEKENDSLWIPFYEEIELLVESDQRFRKGAKITNKQAQDSLDQINRVKLDSLYNLYGFPSINKVGVIGCDGAWLILHHSTDCEWNRTWVVRSLESYNDGICNSFSKTITRFYNSKTGFCNFSDNSPKSRDFLIELKTNYPRLIQYLDDK